MASLLETFAILFESNADEVKAGAEEAGGATDQLEGRILDTSKSSEQLGESFLDLVGSAKNAIANIVSVGAVALGVMSTAQQTDALGKFSQALGLNMEEIGAWSEAVIRSGGSAESFQASVKSLTGQLTDFVLTGGGPAMEVLSRLGISAFNASGKVKTAFELLPDLAETFERMSKAESFAFGQKLGLDQGTIALLQQGREGVNQLVARQRELGVATRDDAEAAAEFNDAWADLKQVFTNVFVSLGGSVLPVLTTVLAKVREFTAFLSDNKPLVEGFFIGLATVIGVSYLPAIAAAAVATVTALAPFLLLAAAIALIALAYDDVIAYTKGHNSLLGEAVKKWPELGEAIDYVVDLFELGKEKVNDLIEAVKKLPEYLKGLLPEVEELWDAFLSIPDDVEGSFKRIAKVLTKLLVKAVKFAFKSLLSLGGFLEDTFKGMFANAGGAAETSFLDALDNLGAKVLELLSDLGGLISDAFSGIFSGVFEGLLEEIPALADFFEGEKPDRFAPEEQKLSQEEVREVMKTARLALVGAESNQLNSGSSMSIANSTQTSNRSTSVSVGNVNVDARGGDATEVATGVSSALSDQMKQAVNDFDDGVAG